MFSSGRKQEWRVITQDINHDRMNENLIRNEQDLEGARRLGKRFHNEFRSGFGLGLIGLFVGNFIPMSSKNRSIMDCKRMNSALKCSTKPFRERKRMKSLKYIVYASLYQDKNQERLNSDYDRSSSLSNAKAGRRESFLFMMKILCEIETACYELRQSSCKLDAQQRIDKVHMCLDSVDDVLKAKAFTARSGARLINALVKLSRSTNGSHFVVRDFLKSTNFCYLWTQQTIPTLDRCSFIDLSIIIYSAGVLELKLSDRFLFSWFHAAGNLQTFNARALSNVLYGFARLDGIALPEEFMTDWFRAFVREVPCMNSQALTNCIWSTARLGFEPPKPVLNSWYYEACMKIDSFNHQALSNSIWAFGKLEILPPASFLELWFQYSCDKISLSTSQELSNCLWGLARLGVTPEETFWKKWKAAFLQRIHQCPTQELSNVLWAMARLRYVADENFLEHWKSTAYQNRNSFSAQELANSVWAFGAMEINPGTEFLQLWLNCCSKSLDSFKPLEISSTLWACARLETNPPLEFSSACLDYLSVTFRVNPSPRIVSNVLWSCARLDIALPEKFWGSWQLAFSAAASKMNIQELSMTLWAFAKLGLNPDDQFFPIWQSRYRDIGLFAGIAEFGMIIWALSRTSERIISQNIECTSAILSQWVEECAQMYSNFTTQELAVCISALGRIGYRPSDEFISGWSSTLIPRMNEMSNEELVSVVYGLARIQVMPTDGLVDLWVPLFHERMSSFASHELSIAIWSIAKLNLTLPQKTTDVFFELSRKQLSQMSAQSLSNTLWASATLRSFPDDEFLNAWCDAFLNHSESFIAKGLSNSIWALATFGFKLSRRVVDAWCTRFSACLPHISDQAIGNAMWAFGSLRIVPDLDLFRVIEVVLSRPPKDVSSHALANVMWSFARLGITPRHQLFDLWNKHFCTTDFHQGDELNAVIWALSRLSPRIDASVYNHWQSCVEKHSDVFTVVQLLSVITSLNRVRSDIDMSFVTELLESHRFKLKNASVRELIALFLVIAKVNVTPSNSFMLLWDRLILERANQLENSQIAAISWAYARLGIEKGAAFSRRLQSAVTHSQEVGV